MKISTKFLDDWANPWRMYFLEFLGTLILVFCVLSINVMTPLYGVIGRVGEALAIGFIYSALLYATVNVSGGFLNPAVTLSLWLCQKISGTRAFFYIFFQIAASFMASVFVILIFSKYANSFSNSLNLGVGVSVESAIVIEAILSAILVFVVFATAVDSRKIEGFGPLAVGLAVTGLNLVFSPLTGAVMNMSTALGLVLVSRVYSLLIVYIVGGLLGSLFGLVYEFTFIKKEKKK